MRRDRLVTLRTTALIAVGFVVLRVVYRVIFGGGSGSGILLIDLPRIALDGPFRGISLLGPLTTGGIADAALSALPFAALIILIGLIGVVVDLRALLVRSANRGPVRTVARTLVIAMSTFPALRDAVVRVRAARELRGERSLASLLVPVLELTVERAITLGASMEVRGFAATGDLGTDRSRPVTFTDVALGFDEGWVLDPVDLALPPGSLTLVTGATGSGKSTLLGAMTGLFQHLAGGHQAGDILIGGVDRLAVPPRETAGFVGVVCQSVRLSFVASSVVEELGFGLATRGTAASVVAERVAEVAAELGIAHLLDRPVAALSAGEACLVALGAAVVGRPALLVMDEPLADLDTAARERVVALLDRLAHDQGVCVVVAEHALDEWEAVADQWLELRDAAVALMDRDEASGGAESGPEGDGRPPTGTGSTIARIRRLSASHGASLAVDAVSFDLDAGEPTALVGPNGAGKSTLLLELARPAAKAAVIVDGVDVATLTGAARRASVALVPEASDDLLFASTVAAECRRADRRAAASGTAGVFLSLLGLDDAGAGGAAHELLDRHPRDLSAGERLCLVIAIQLSARPRVLLLDEPTRGLDIAARTLVGDAVTRIAAQGTAVLFATHDRAFAERHASRSITMNAGRLTETKQAVLR